MFMNYQVECVWELMKLKLIRVFSLFVLLFMGLISLFSIINESHYTIQLAFSFFLQYFQ